MSSTSEDILHKLLAIDTRKTELENLPDGPVADTYEYLHGIHYIDLLLEMAGENHNDIRSLMEYAIGEILYQNLAALVERLNAAVLEEAFSEAAGLSDWLHKLGKLHWQILQRLSEAEPGLDAGQNEPAENAGTPAFLAYHSALEILQNTIETLTSSRSFDIPGSINFGYITDPGASMVQNLKMHILYAKLTQSYRRSGEPNRRFSLAELDVVSKILHSMARNFDTNRRTYLMQFRLLHQIPELVAPGLTNDFGLARLAIKQGHLTEAIFYSKRIRNSMSIIVDCLFPLLELMWPSEYYLIRRHLGATSGMLSRRFGMLVLKESYFKFAQEYSSADKLKWNDLTEQNLAGDILRGLVSEISQQLSIWRQLHLGLPRNVLGGNKTKSVIGSDDAITQADAMRRSFNRSDPIRTGLPVDSLVSKAALGHDPITTIDQILLTLTGDATKKNFRDVQEREGRYRKATAHREQ